MDSNQGSCFLISHRFKTVLEYYQWAPVHLLKGVEWFLQMRQKEDNVEIVLFFKPENHLNQSDKYCRAVANLRLVMGQFHLPLQNKVVLYASDKAETSFYEKILYRDSKNSFLNNSKIVKNGEINIELYVTNVELRKFRVRELSILTDNSKLLAISHVYKVINEPFQISPIHTFNNIVWFLSVQSIEDNIVVVLIIRPLQHLENNDAYGYLQADVELEIGGVRMPPMKILDCSTTDNANNYFLEKTIFDVPKRAFLRGFAHYIKKGGIPISVYIRDVQIEVFKTNEVEDNIEDPTPSNATACSFSFFADLPAHNQLSVHVFGNTEWLVVSKTAGESFEISLQVRSLNEFHGDKRMQVSANVNLVMESKGSVSIRRSEFSEIMWNGESCKTLLTKKQSKLLLDSFSERPRKLDISVYISNITISEAKNLKHANLWSTPCKRSDIILLVEEQELHCHTQILISHCKGFERLLDEAREQMIEISLDVGIGLEDFLEFLYQIYNMATPITEKNLRILLYFAEKYEDDQILLLCEKFLSHCFENEEDGIVRCELLLISWVYNFHQLKKVFLNRVLYSECPPAIQLLMKSEYYQNMEEKNKLEFTDYLFSTPLKKIP